MSIGPGAIMGRWAATKLRDAISNWRKNKKKTKQKEQDFNPARDPNLRSRDPNVIQGEGFTMRNS